MTDNSDIRVVSWYTSGDARQIVAMRRTPETDALTDEELIARLEKEWPASERPGRLADE
ncbi:hypothetical protein ACWDG1_09315 [Streptomyces sp. NPDC001177]